MAFERTRRPMDTVQVAEAAFKKATTKPIAGPVASAAVPGARETVSLRIDQDVLEKFKADGPGWQERINTALRLAAGL